MIYLLGLSHAEFGSHVASPIPNAFPYPTSKILGLHDRCCSADHWALELLADQLALNLYTFG